MDHFRLKQNNEFALCLSLKAVAFIVADEPTRGRFLELTGLDAQGLKEGLENPQFLGSVLDFVLGDETLLMVFCANAGVEPDSVSKARMQLPGANEAYG